MSDDREYHEIELFVLVDGERLVIGMFEGLDEEMQTVTRESCAEVSIPHLTETAVYAFNCFLLHVPADMPAVFEMAFLKKMSSQMYRDFVVDVERLNETE